MIEALDRIAGALWDAGLREDHDVCVAYASAVIEAALKETPALVEAMAVAIHDNRRRETVDGVLYSHEYAQAKAVLAAQRKALLGEE